MVRNRLLGLGLCALLCALGCGCGGADKPPPLFSVTGKVTYNGKSVPGATIMFFQDQRAVKKGETDQRPPYRPIGKADDEGNYELYWNDDLAGAPAGNYRVAISAVEFEPGDDDEVARPNKVPAKYGNPDKSGFTADVEEGGENVFNFELKD